jgi:hypothetical protein
MADITVQSAGALDAWFALALLNNKAITERLAPGEALLTPAPDPRLALMARRLQQPDNRPASGTLDEETTLPGGIGYMQIGNDFVVSP